jgi:hypothetical protein
MILIFIYFTIKLNGAHSTKSTINHSVPTLIIGKILGENLIFSLTIAMLYAKIGSQIHLLLSIMRAV